MSKLLSGETIVFERGKTERVESFLEWKKFNHSFFLSVSQFNEESKRSSDEMRKCFFESVQDAIDSCNALAGQKDSPQGRSSVEKKRSDSKMILTLRPSSVAKYFEYKCDRYLVLNSLPSSKKSSKNSPQREEKNEEFNGLERKEKKGFANDAGNKWEKDVWEYLKATFPSSDDPKSKGLKDLLRELFQDGDHQRDLITGNGEVLFVYQSAFSVEWEEDLPAGVSWSKIKPDLLLLEKDKSGVWDISVIDVKIAGNPHLSHIMQVGLYLKKIESDWVRWKDEARFIANGKLVPIQIDEISWPV